MVTFAIYIGVLLPILSYAAFHKEHIVPVSGFCKVGTVAENDCNKCICSNYIFQCHTKPCNETDVVPNHQSHCVPSMFYVHNTTVCLCNKNGTWPHGTCYNMFKSLPTISNPSSCEPHSYVIIDCNVCKCSPEGKIDREHCTKNECKKTNKTIRRRFVKENQVYGSCEAQNWYSLAPCQFCYCISENKLVCNTGHNYSERLQLGSYDLSICGKDILRDAIGLLPDRDVLLRIGEPKIENKTTNPLVINRNISASITIKDGHTSIELNRENYKKTSQSRNKKVNDSEEYYSEDTDEEITTLSSIGREGSSTKLPYEEDFSEDGKDSAESGNEMSVGIDVQTTKPAVAMPAPSRESINQALPKKIEWSVPSTGNEDLTGEAYNLRDVLKPYLPVVLDKVFQMALRKSMVSVDPHTNCTPGASTVYKCNACFCMKNNKLLCTKNRCQ